MEMHPKTNDQCHRHTQGKTTDIDKGMPFCFNEVSPGDREIVFALFSGASVTLVPVHKN